MIIQFCGLPGAGKTTLANNAKVILSSLKIDVEIIDGDEYRKTICADLGFTKDDRNENIKRLAFVANNFSHQNKVAIVCAVNPYEETRNELTKKYDKVKTVFIKCNLETLIKRDPKGLYKRALMPDENKDKIYNLTGINDPFEIPINPDLIIDTSNDDIQTCTNKLVDFISNEHRQ